MPQVLLNYFQKYLQTESANKKIAAASIKNYVSDINLFLNWVSRTLQEDNVQPKHLTPAIITAYQNYLTSPRRGPERNLPTQSGRTDEGGPASPSSPRVEAGLGGHSSATTQRHLSSLRRFGEFLVSTNRLTEDPTKTLITLPQTTTWAQITNRYVEFLKHENLSKSTVKNYLSDLNQYLDWSNKNTKLTDNNKNKRPSN